MQRIVDAASSGVTFFDGFYFEETTAVLKFSFAEGNETKSLSLQEILAKLYDPDRAVRRTAAASISADSA